MIHRLSRRQLIGTGLALAGAGIAPRFASAADMLVAATFPGTWNDAQKTILVPHFHAATGADVTLTIMLATDQIAKLSASKGAAPSIDVAIMDEGPLLDGLDQGLFEKYPTAKSPHYTELLPVFQDQWGPKISIQAIGIGYNPKKIKTPPTSWNDLFKPEYKGRVGLTALNSTLGMAFMVDLARVNGGSESNIEPAFVALKKLLPNVGAISANLGAHAALFQQEQVDIAPHNFNFVQTLKAKGVDIEFAKLETGVPAWRTSLHIVKGSPKADLAAAYIDGHIDPAVQEAMSKPPYDIIPTNGKVPMPAAAAKVLAPTQADLAKLVYFDWAKINQDRSAWIERFNREIKV
ncbi:MAG TPA: extracellular solute-binding protein [Stellaceae bacterium]|jgi:putative spermidine/putrescine transport system substrate-binding protein|nr:extracellular solute-binding protein [Stellaceae bacterium]